jgi:hypothetical protein
MNFEWTGCLESGWLGDDITRVDSPTIAQVGADSPRCRYCTILTKTGIWRQILLKLLNNKCYETPFYSSVDVSCIIQVGKHSEVNRCIFATFRRKRAQSITQIQG